MPAFKKIALEGDRKVLVLTYQDGRTARLEAELLRVHSPSAEVQGHGGGPTFPAGKRDVAIRKLESVGNYALRIVFDDGHQTGIYTWEYFEELIDQHADKWQQYLLALRDTGKTRAEQSSVLHIVDGL